VLGKDAYRKDNRFDDDDSDPHGYKIGFNTLIPKPVERRALSGLLGDGVLDSPHNGPKPVHEAEIPKKDLENVKEYGYGFWMRFLTAYPVRLLNGKNAPWYFVSRLTSNKPYDDVGMGDRLLAIW